ncbi:hypothetical protein BJY24_001674 [Nocardia transvalensis]|uniref:Uncharacterized protein n=1 Tax=Nocardia transvalensis TaxID=37333 RepID=A0A7W9PB40_9NOCA|nr:hypothetical protein [Nocardia transvalensis]MBB5912807.1 hypothetical protein [Nocardia transvalensis]
MTTKTCKFSHSLIGLTAALTLVGCATVTGNSKPAEIDVRKLDTGSYSTEPNDLRYDYTPTLEGNKAEAIFRLADVVAPGPEIDPKLNYGAGATEIRLPQDAVKSKYLENFSPVLLTHQMLYGLTIASSDKPSETGSTDGDTYVEVTIFQFPDEKNAADAAREYETADFDIAKDQNQPVTLAKYPQALSHWRPGIRTLGARMARGSYLVNLFVRTPKDNLSDLTALAERAYDVQLPLLDTLKPLSKREILHLSKDPLGIMRKTLHPEDYFTSSIINDMAIGPRGFVNLVGMDKKGAKSMLDRAGVDAIGVVNRVSIAYRARDEEAAKGLIQQTRDSTAKRPVDPPPGIPNSSCTEDTNTSVSYNRYACLVRYDRYVAKISSGQLMDAYQRSAAQFALFANSSW